MAKAFSPEHRAKISAGVRAAKARRAVWDTKPCPRCEVEVLRADYPKKPDGRLHSLCGPCKKASDRERALRHYRRNRERAAERHKSTSLRRHHGITQTDYEMLLAEQGGCCAICGSATDRSVRDRRLGVDHCHDTGRIRGLLCSPCNSAIGLMKDTPEWLRAAADYLERPTTHGLVSRPGMSSGHHASAGLSA